MEIPEVEKSPFFMSIFMSLFIGKYIESIPTEMPFYRQVKIVWKPSVYSL